MTPKKKGGKRGRGGAGGTQGGGGRLLSGRPRGPAFSIGPFFGGVLGRGKKNKGGGCGQRKLLSGGEKRGGRGAAHWGPGAKRLGAGFFRAFPLKKG